MRPNTTVCNTRPISVGHPLIAMELPNTDDVNMYMNGEATTQKMTADKTEMEALVDVESIVYI
jgi:hypothetical protein